MAQLTYQLAYVTTFVLALTGGSLVWLLVLVPLSLPLHFWMRWEGHQRFAMPMEDWSPASFALLVFGQICIHLVIFGCGSALRALAGLTGLV
ncbi:MAG: hypothetical protein AAFY02_01055 [Pseudomonadota bacterium]